MTPQHSTAMNIEQMMGRYQRLQQELSIAYNQHPWQSGRIDRLAQELAQVEHEIVQRRPGSVLPGGAQDAASRLVN